MSNNPNVQIVKSTKSVGVAVLLSMLFGPIGMFYSTILGAIVMLPISFIVGLVTMGFGLLLTFPICAIWAGIAAASYNRSITR